MVVVVDISVGMGMESSSGVVGVALVAEIVVVFDADVLGVVGLLVAFVDGVEGPIGISGDPKTDGVLYSGDLLELFSVVR